MVDNTVDMVTNLLKKADSARLEDVENQEKQINDWSQEIEEKCLELLIEKDNLSAKDVRTLVSCTLIVSKLERLGDHANRVARIASWAREEEIEVPDELPQMSAVVHHMMQDALLTFVTNDLNKVTEVLQQDSQVNYLHDVMSKRLLSKLGEQEQASAHMGAQFLFCARFIERMGDLCTSVAKRVHFINTGKRLSSRSPAPDRG
ncbi:MAG: phosphate transport system regulatory protein PhoU [Candidatus Melainabacteria bacterium]|nr:MAG: phosphate transport system regulatory protein PhoU [Candidatus Melainabacteria bacterium]